MVNAFTSDNVPQYVWMCMSEKSVSDNRFFSYTFHSAQSIKLLALLASSELNCLEESSLQFPLKYALFAYWPDKIWLIYPKWLFTQMMSLKYTKQGNDSI